MGGIVVSDKGPLKYYAVSLGGGGWPKYDIVLHGGGGGGQNMIFYDMGGRPDIIWYITALVALLAALMVSPYMKI